MKPLMQRGMGRYRRLPGAHAAGPMPAGQRYADQEIRQNLLFTGDSSSSHESFAGAGQSIPTVALHQWPAAKHGRAARRVLLYSHDTFGLGHLRRNLAIVEHLMQRKPPFSGMLLTGSPMAGSWPMPTGLEVRALPPVIKVGAEEYAARDLSSSFEAVKAQREAAILDAIASYRPDFFLIDHAPAGMKGELLPALRFIRKEMPATRTVLGLRDVIDSPETVRQIWQTQGIYELLETEYDQILVYGSRHLFDVVSAYKLSPRVAAKVRYCGYVARTGLHGVADVPVAPSGLPVVLVTVGGGGDGYALIDAYLEALRRIPQNTVHSIVVPGPLMPPDQYQSLAGIAAQRPDIRIIPYTTELVELLHMADLVVAMGGYNTTAEILAARKPAILVPRSTPRMEQWLRATMLSQLGLVWVIQPEEDLVGRLVELVPAAVAGDRPPGKQWDTVDLGGVHRVGEVLEEMLHSGTSTGISI
ncbi:Glycosyltransferase 28 domain-containing protein [Acidithiobacillus ferrivorans SS3]|uniref:Glycosyltransferase 28 domain-containing protein n=1 Tax=Acidithiobacillus ferrivorans SS3 TaxID=743299 RepID=G0JND9_9PROT|nr:glycosyltransferase [Acidithiobacillus ferrivorans]AEM47169.1 Glycosyltransferase 28 domain-containing protein [Acidithiobacillus ferrivorans SS3]OFA15359.1 histidine kinase [Acidithiobacillus ferrivorans]